MARRKTAIAPVVTKKPDPPIVYAMELGGVQVKFGKSFFYASTHRPIHIKGTQAYFMYDMGSKCVKLDGIYMEGGSLQTSDALRIHIENMIALCDLADEFARKFEAGEYTEVERG